MFLPCCVVFVIQKTHTQTKKLAFKKQWRVILIKELSDLLWIQTPCATDYLFSFTAASPHLEATPARGLHFSLLHIHQLADIRQACFYKQHRPQPTQSVSVSRGIPRAQWAGQSFRWSVLVLILYVAKPTATSGCRRKSLYSVHLTSSTSKKG